MSLPVSPHLLASTIEMMLSEANITTVDAFAELLLRAKAGTQAGVMRGKFRLGRPK